jgi:hypothetical protein
LDSIKEKNYKFKYLIFNSPIEAKRRKNEKGTNYHLIWNNKIIMKKQKDFDTFSFNNDISHNHDFEDRKQLMANYQYRIDTL